MITLFEFFPLRARIIIVALSLLCTGNTSAQITYFDSIFSQGDWGIKVFVSPASAALASQELGPAPRLQYQRIQHVLAGGGAEVLSLHIYLRGTYDPKRDCPIAFIDYQEQARTLATEPGTFGAGTGPAIWQEGNFYVADFAPTRTNVNGQIPSPYLAVSFAGLTANSFRLVRTDGTFDNSRHPDFSRAGSPIQFGFARRSSHTGFSTVTRQTAIDDWSVSVTSLAWSVADFGDAPDESLGMQTGYYGFTSTSGFVFTIVSQSALAHFPTVLANSGPFAIMNDLFIAPLPGTLESDAIGPVDADPVFNLNQLADDADNDFADSSQSMVLIFGLGPRPPALFFTVAARAPSGPQQGYWNVGIDLNQNGDWGPGEWISQDIKFDFGTNTWLLLQSPFFAWGPPGATFGRLTFPVWARNMITSEMVGTNTPLSGPAGMQYYAGAGPVCGFTNGEIEDYFIEWFPIGQLLGDAAERKKMVPDYGPDIPANHLAQIQGPENILAGERVEYRISGPPLKNISIMYLPDAATGGVAGPGLKLTPDEPGRFGSLQTEDLGVEVEWAYGEAKLYITPRRAVVPSTLVVFGEPADRGIAGPGISSGSAAPLVFGAARITIQEGIRITRTRMVGNSLLIEWTGHTGRYKVQYFDYLGSEGRDVVVTSETTASVPASGSIGFFRVVADSADANSQ